MMKILLTGATGFLGSHLLKSLLKEGYDVIALKRSTSDTNRLTDLLPHIQFINMDEDNLQQCFHEYGQIDVVVHVAACYGRNGEKDSDIMMSNTLFPLKLLETAGKNGVRKFINTDTSLDKFLNSYSLSKKHFVDWGRLLARQYKTGFVNIKLEHFYGPGDDDSKFTTYIVRSCLKNVKELNLTQGEQKRDFIHINDVISAYMILIKNLDFNDQSFEEYELGSGSAVTIREFVEKVRQITGASTVLNFGALPYRDKEVMESKANVEPLLALGWKCSTTLEKGLKSFIAKEKMVGKFY